MSAPAAVLFPSHAAGDASYIPSLSQSDVLSAALTCAFASLLLLPSAAPNCADTAVPDTEMKVQIVSCQTWIVVLNCAAMETPTFYNQFAHAMM